MLYFSDTLITMIFHPRGETKKDPANKYISILKGVSVRGGGGGAREGVTDPENHQPWG